MKAPTFLLLLLLLACRSNPPLTEALGTVNLEVTGNERAVAQFERGLLLLHSFEYEDAREAFRAARELDPNTPMAYWGEAMTHNHSLWREQDYDAATRVLAELEAVDLQRHATELERDFIRAVRVLYRPKMGKAERDLAYADQMGRLREKYPDKHEVAAFYALALLGSVADGRDYAIYGRGAEVALGVLAENPDHPGALHYTIHAYDDPDHAALALDAADAYARVAPDASHALHMPSHIYVALGMWDRVVASNVESYQASLNRMERKGLDNDARGYHAFHWLEYGYLQQGKRAEAEKMVLEMERFAREKPSVRARTHLVFLKGTYLAETGAWAGAVADIPVEVSDLSLAVRSQYHFLEGMKAHAAGDTLGMDHTIAAMQQEMETEAFVQENTGTPMCAGANRRQATPSDLITARVRRRQLLGLREMLAGRTERAEAHLLEAIALQERVDYNYGPPPLQVPPRELYAAWLVADQRYAEARDAYTRAQREGPQRRSIVAGLAEVERQLKR